MPQRHKNITHDIIVQHTEYLLLFPDPADRKYASSGYVCRITGKGYTFKDSRNDIVKREDGEYCLYYRNPRRNHAEEQYVPSDVPTDGTEMIYLRPMIRNATTTLVNHIRGLTTLEALVHDGHMNYCSLITTLVQPRYYNISLLSTYLLPDCALSPITTAAEKERQEKIRVLNLAVAVANLEEGQAEQQQQLDEINVHLQGLDDGYQELYVEVQGLLMQQQQQQPAQQPPADEANDGVVNNDNVVDEQQQPPVDDAGGAFYGMCYINCLRIEYCCVD